MEGTELTPHIEELKRVLGNKVDDETLRSELLRYINDYHVDPESAKRGILRKFGDDEAVATASNVEKSIADLNGTEQNVDITAKVVFVDTKNITVKGLEKTIVSGLLGDSSGTASFTIWEPGALQLQKGVCYKFKSCYCKKWNDRVQINIGNRGRIESAPEGTEFDVPSSGSSAEPSDIKIGEIRDGVGNVNVTGRILSVESRRINSRGEEKTVYSGIIADETGKITFSAWQDFGLNNNMTVCAKNCYVRSWRGIPQLNIGDRAVVERVDAVIEVNEGEGVRSIGDVTRVGGGIDITLEGMVVDVKKGSGIIQRCPECKRSMNDGVCTLHGSVEGVPDMRLKIILDDGTGAIGAVLNRDYTEKLTGISLNQAMGLAAARGQGVVTRELTEKILMRKVRIRGNVMSDDYGPSMIVQSASEVEVDIVKEAEELLKSVEAAL